MLSSRHLQANGIGQLNYKNILNNHLHLSITAFHIAVACITIMLNIKSSTGNIALGLKVFTFGNRKIAISQVFPEFWRTQPNLLHSTFTLPRQVHSEGGNLQSHFLKCHGLCQGFEDPAGFSWQKSLTRAGVVFLEATTAAHQQVTFGKSQNSALPITGSSQVRTRRKSPSQTMASSEWIFKI